MVVESGSVIVPAFVVVFMSAKSVLRFRAITYLLW
jgi:hypothetical protein